VSVTRRCQTCGVSTRVSDTRCQAGGVKHAVLDAGVKHAVSGVVSRRKCQTRGGVGRGVRRDVVWCQWRGGVCLACEVCLEGGSGGWRKTAPFKPAVRGRAGDRGAHHMGDCLPSSV
jgi:hypothetical protein